MSRLLDQFFTHYRDILRDWNQAGFLSVRTQRLVLLLVVLIGCCIRLWLIGIPALDRTCWKEIDYLQISNNYWKHGYHFLSPEITWPAEPPRVTAMEFPLVPYLAAILYSTMGYHALSARLVPLLAWVLLSVYVFRLVRRETNPVTALAASVAATFMPFFNAFGRILFSEPLMIALSVAAIYHYAEWIQFRRLRDWISALVSFSLAVALKLEPLFLAVVFAWIVYREHKVEVKAYAQLAGFLALALILPATWYSYAFYLSRTSIDVFGVVPFLQGHDKLQTLTMLSDPAWYRTMAARLVGGVGGKIGVGFCGVGAAAIAGGKRGTIFFVYLLAVFVYFAVVAEGNIDAPYRQLNAIPALAVFLGNGAVVVGVAANALTRTVGVRVGPKTILAICLILIPVSPLRMRYQLFHGDPLVPSHPESWTLAQAIRKHSGPADKLIAIGEYSIHKGGNDLSPVLYHYSERQGWSLQRDQWTMNHVDGLILRGATLFAATQMSREPDSKPFLESMEMRFPTLHKDTASETLLLDLRRRQ